MKVVSEPTYEKVIATALAQIELDRGKRDITTIRPVRNKYGEIISVTVYRGAVAGRGGWKKREEGQ